MTDARADDRLVRNNGGISEPEFRLAPTIAYVSQSQRLLRASSSRMDLDALQWPSEKEPQMRKRGEADMLQRRPECSMELLTVRRTRAS